MSETTTRVIDFEQAAHHASLGQYPATPESWERQRDLLLHGARLAARIEELERALEEIDNRSQAPRLKDDAQVAAIRQCARDALVSREADAKGRNRE